MVELTEFAALPGALTDVLEGAACGETIKETARRRFTSETTVRAQRRDIICRLRARNIAHAVAIAFCHGLLRADVFSEAA